MNNLYNWQFDTTGFGTATNPTHVFPDTGVYTVRLIAGIKHHVDTSYKEVSVDLTGVQLPIL